MVGAAGIEPATLGLENISCSVQRVASRRKWTQSASFRCVWKQQKLTYTALWFPDWFPADQVQIDESARSQLPRPGTEIGVTIQPRSVLNLWLDLTGAIERGEKDLRLTTLVKLANTFRMPLGELFK
jgi:hypothetical protein